MPPDPAPRRKRLSLRRLAGGWTGVVVGILLAVQLGLAQRSMPRVAAADPLAALSAAIGQPVVICHHARHDGDDPAQSDDCDHCPLCRLATHDVAIVTAAPPLVPRTLAVVAARERPIVGFTLTWPVHAGGATPRGPPRSA